MSYVDAFQERDSENITVIERVNSERKIITYPIEYVFYYQDPKGKYQSIFGDSLSKFSTRKKSDFHKELRAHSHKKIFESDINPVIRCLSTNYLGQPSPKLHVAFFDIETAFDPTRGFSPPEDPFAEINAVTVYLDWLDQLVTLVIPPKSLTKSNAEAIVNKFENTLLVNSEKELIETFLDLIVDADVLSGWNSEGFDIPYLVNRTIKSLGKDDTRRFCLCNQFPKTKEYEMYGQVRSTYELVGRIHLDYLALYRKYNYEERHSYALNAIGELELGETKVQYEGTLDSLYNNDFEKFIDYNRQDVKLLAKLDHKLKFIDLASEMAHTTTVLIPSVMGTVAMVDNAIVNEIHRQNLIAPSKTRTAEIKVSDSDDEEDEAKAAGAYVAYPKKGLHDWIGFIDLNSLYPNTIRALNLTPETIVGQLRQDLTRKNLAERMESGMSSAKAWEGVFACWEYQAVMAKDPNQYITIDWEDGSEPTEMTADKIYDFVYNNQNLMLTANGTLINRNKPGIIPNLLASWYNGRKQMQKTKKRFDELSRGIQLPESLLKDLK